MTHRDQLEFKIRKLTRAITAIDDLPSTPGLVTLLAEWAHERMELRRAIADGRRSCGE